MWGPLGCVTSEPELWQGPLVLQVLIKIKKQRKREKATDWVKEFSLSIVQVVRNSVQGNVWRQAPLKVSRKLLIPNI